MARKAHKARRMDSMKTVAATLLTGAAIIGGGVVTTPEANAGTLTGTCSSGFTYNSATRKCEGSNSAYAAYTWGNCEVYSMWVAIGANPKATDFPLPSTLTNQGFRAFSTQYFAEYGGGASGSSARVQWDCIKKKLSPGAGWVDDGTRWVYTIKVFSDPQSESENYATEKAAIDAVLTSGTSSEAAAKLTAAETAYAGLKLSSSKDALKPSMDAARAKPAQLKAAEDAEAARVTTFTQTVNTVLGATTSADASTKLASAQSAFNALNASNRAAQQSKMDAAVAHIDSLKTNEREASRVVDFVNAANAVINATTSADASSKLASAQSAFNALNGANQAAQKAKLDAASQRVADLKAKELADANEATQLSAARSSISRAMSAGTYATASGHLATAEEIFGLLNATSKASVQGDLDGAKNRVATLKANEEEAARVEAARNAIAKVQTATSSEQAKTLLTAAEAEVAKTNPGSRESLAADLAGAQKKLNDLVTAELTAKSNAEKAQIAEKAAKEAAAASTYAEAKSKVIEAEAAINAITDGDKSKAQAALDAAKAHADALKKAEDLAAASRAVTRQPSVVSSPVGGSPAGSNAAQSGPSDRGSSDPAAKIKGLVAEILATSPADASAKSRLIIASAEMNALVRNNPALVTEVLRGDVKRANDHVASALGAVAGQPGSVQIVAALVGRGETRGSDIKHATAVSAKLKSQKDIVLVTIAADKDWSKAKRAWYQNKMKAAAVKAGVDASKIKIVKPRLVETVSVYAVTA